MDLTIQTIKNECSSLPRSTGFGRVSELEMFWRQMKAVSRGISDQSFSDRVYEFANPQ